MRNPSYNNFADILMSADLKEKNQDYISALSEYNLILESDPTHTAAQFGKGRCTALLNSLTQTNLEEACDEIQAASAYPAPVDPEVAKYTAWVLAKSVFNSIVTLDDINQRQLLSTLNESSSRFFTSGFGGSINQARLDKINSVQNKQFQSFVNLFARALHLSWSLSNDEKTASQIMAVMTQVKNSQILQRETIHLFVNALEPLTRSIKGLYPDILGKNSARKKPFSWGIFLVLLVVIIGLLWVIISAKP